MRAAHKHDFFFSAASVFFALFEGFNTVQCTAFLKNRFPHLKWLGMTFSASQ